MSQPLLAGIFLFLFLRHKHLNTIASLVGSLCFAFSGFSVAWLTWGTIGSTLLWLPLILLSFEMIHESSKKMLWRMVFIFSVVSSFFAGHIQVFMYGILVFAAYALWTFRKTKTKQIFAMHVVIPIIILAITSPVWIRLLSYLPDTSRISGSVWTVEGFFIPIRHLIQFIVPDFFGNPATLNYWGTWNYGEMVGYIGVIGLLLAIIGISVQSVFWLGVICISLLFAIDSPIARLPFVLHIPWISSLQPTRLLSVVDFGLSVLAAYGTATIMEGKNKKRILVAGVLLFVLFAGAWMSVVMPKSFGVPLEQIAIVKRNLILPSILLIIALGITGIGMVGKKSWSIIRNIVVGIALIVLTFELIRFGWKFTPFTPQSFFFPETEIISQLEQFPKPFRIIATDDRVLPPNVLSYYDIEAISGYDPIHTLRYEEYMAAMERGEPNIKPPFGFTRIIAPKTITSPLLSLLNVQYVISMDPLSGKNVRLLSEEGTTKLYKFVGGVPRVYFAEQIITASSKESAIQKLYDPGFISGKTAVVESPIALASAPLVVDETITISAYQGDRMTIETTTKNTRLLVVANMMDSHWKATIDGKRTDIVRVNYLFFGIIVPDGTHTVAVQYK